MAEFSSQGKEYWKVIKITGERAKTYQIEWAGTDPETGKPWPLDWVPKEDVTSDLVEVWEEGKEERERRKGVFLFDFFWRCWTVVAGWCITVASSSICVFISISSLEF